MTLDAAIANAKQLTMELLSVSRRGNPTRVTTDAAMRQEYASAIEELLYEANAARILRAEVLRLARVLANAVNYYVVSGEKSTND